MQLQLLNLSRNNLTELGLHKLKACLAMSGVCIKLSTLKIASNNGGSSVVGFFELGKDRPLLIDIDASQNNADFLDSNVTLSYNRGTVDISTLVALDLSFNPVRAMIEFLRFLFPSILLFQLGNFGLVKFFKNACKARQMNMKALTLQSTDMGDDAVFSLCKLVSQHKLPTLQALSLGANHISHMGAEALLEVFTSPTAPALRHLAMPLNNLGNEGLLMFVAKIIGGFLDGFEVIQTSRAILHVLFDQVISYPTHVIKPCPEILFFSH